MNAYPDGVYLIQKGTLSFKIVIKDHKTYGLDGYSIELMNDSRCIERVSDIPSDWRLKLS